MKKSALLLMLLALVPVHASALDTTDLLSLVAMPLAVDAVSRVTGVPQDQLAQFVTALNQASVAPAQFVDTLRYVPVALVEQPDFVPYVQTQVANGVSGSALVTVINQRLPSFTPAPAQTSMIVDDSYVPQTVRTRVAEAHAHPLHPHGGPPGQLKKMIGVQTGAEIVHGTQPAHIPPGQAKKEERRADGEMHGHGHGHGKGQAPVVYVQPPMTSAAPAPVYVPPPQDNGKGHGRGPGGEGPPGQQKEKGGKGHGKG